MKQHHNSSGLAENNSSTFNPAQSAEFLALTTGHIERAVPLLALILPVSYHEAQRSRVVFQRFVGLEIFNEGPLPLE